MNKSVLGILIAVVAVLGLGGIIASNSRMDNSEVADNSRSSSSMSGMDMQTQNENEASTSGNEAQATNTVIIKDFEFMPQKITVKKGTTVTWTNEDSARHNAFGDDPNGPKGELLSKGESYSHTFNTVGTFNYICEPHPYMKAVVEVTE